MTAEVEMAGYGLLPKPARRRKNAAITKTGLPAEGRLGPTPRWPLAGGSDRELALAEWAAVWRLPVATMWERAGWFHEVAVYVRWLVQAEKGSVEASQEMHMWSDRIGMNPQTMQRLGWVDEPLELLPPALFSAPRPRRRVAAVDPSIISKESDGGA